MANDMMRAVRFHAYGGPEELVVEQVPRPEPKESEVLVRVHAAGVNPIDWKIRKGLAQAFIPLTLPSTPGVDLAGVVASVGPGVTNFPIGLAVFGRGTATYAEYALAPAADLAPKPEKLTFDEAAAVPVGACTAWAGLFVEGELQPGQRLLVHGGAGGVGAYAVQFGRWKGAHVTATASAANVEFVHSLGAETVIDYNSTPFESVVHDVDVVLDTIGGSIQDRSLQVLRPGGILVTVAGQPQEQKAKELGVRTAGVSLLGKSQAPVLRQISELIDSGAVVPVVGKVFSLEEAGQAQALSETGHGRGRIVLHVAG